jgi:hypothetical protein
MKVSKIAKNEAIVSHLWPSGKEKRYKLYV